MPPKKKKDTDTVIKPTDDIKKEVQEQKSSPT